ncbi:MAG TPA: LysR substrate-binding domain-containing protein [Paenalcaligenes sp.]|nr:LysR substrate-binding domain-containing protein [Paenalcaligenes sp.]
MTFTELRYIVAVARERHFGRAAEACFVSQPTLSVAVKKLEEELGVVLFERGGTEIGVTPIGLRIIEQAQRILEEGDRLREIALQGQDPLTGPLKVGVIYTVAPYLLPLLVPAQIQLSPQMPLVLQENYTVKLLELLRQGEIDCAIVALPLPESGFMTKEIYQEPFIVAIPHNHPWTSKELIDPEELKSETMLLLGAGHCFRDQVLDVCPELSHFSPSSEGIQKTFEGSSLETIRHMVATGIGITVLPASAKPERDQKPLLHYVPFKEPVPSRTIALVWRRSFPRISAIEALAQAIRNCGLPCVDYLPDAGHKIND